MKSPHRVLFLCTGNSARSIFAEAILRHDGGGRFLAFSAGSHPAGRVNPLAIETLQAMGYPVSELRSKSWDEFERADAPPMDLIITVCDNAAGEVCPIWPGSPAKAHWGIPDPAAILGSDAQRRAAFRYAFHTLKQHVARLVALPHSVIASSELSEKLRGIANDS